MDLIQQVSIMALLTLVIYFLMVNWLDKNNSVPTQGDALKTINYNTEVGNRSNGTINNKLNLGANNVPIEGINLAVGTHSRTTVGEPVKNEIVNTTELAVYNDQLKGVLPVNHDLFEKEVDFSSDVTNINQFYRNNPDIFDKSTGGAYVPDVNSWDTLSSAMFSNVSRDNNSGPVREYNYQDNYQAVGR